MTLPEPGDQRSASRTVVEWIALGLHVAVGFFPYGAGGLLMPLWGWAVGYLIWFLLFAVAWRWRPDNRWLLLSIPLAAVVLFFVWVSVGEALFGWAG